MDHNLFTTEEFQKIVIMLGSKTKLGIYLGLQGKELDEIWKGQGLLTPAEWFRRQPRSDQLNMLAQAGSLKVLSKKISCSESTLRGILVEKREELDWEEAFLLEQLDRYGSVRLVAFIHNCGEAHIRRLAERMNVQLAALIDYTTGENSNSKGRRAELEFAELRKHKILADRNVEDGSQALWDYDDIDLGKVNVKSSKRYKYTAQTRRAAPYYWKFSTSGREEAETFVCLCYDDKMGELLGVLIRPAKELPQTSTFTITDPERTHALHPSSTSA